MKVAECPIFDATGEKVEHRGDECHVCPFRIRCPFDTLDTAMMGILKDIGGYFGGKKESEKKL